MGSCFSNNGEGKSSKPGNMNNHRGTKDNIFSR